MADMTVGRKTSITVQFGILVAIVAAVFKAGAIAEKVEQRPSGGERGLSSLVHSVDNSGTSVDDVNRRLERMNEDGTTWAMARWAEIEARLAAVEHCAKARHRSCDI